MSETYGARFVDEVRRITRSTWGLGYRELERVARMEREAFLAAFGPRLAAFGDAWLEAHLHLDAEDLARAVIREAEERAAKAGKGRDLFDLLLSW